MFQEIWRILAGSSVKICLVDKYGNNIVIVCKKFKTKFQTKTFNVLIKLVLVISNKLIRRSTSQECFQGEFDIR